jgi:hypothetical protein
VETGEGYGSLIAEATVFAELSRLYIYMLGQLIHMNSAFLTASASSSKTD